MSVSSPPSTMGKECHDTRPPRSWGVASRRCGRSDLAAQPKRTENGRRPARSSVHQGFLTMDAATVTESPCPFGRGLRPGRLAGHTGGAGHAGHTVGHVAHRRVAGTVVVRCRGGSGSWGAGSTRRGRVCLRTITWFRRWGGCPRHPIWSPSWAILWCMRRGRRGRRPRCGRSRTS